jgi:2-methylcitrate dehydratase PrpD
METILALAAVYGEITFQHIHDSKYREDPRVRDFRERARIMIIPRPQAASAGERLEMDITVRTREGEVLHQELRYPLMSEEEIQQKFRNLVGMRLKGSQVADLEKKLKAVETAENVAPLIEELAIDY